MGWLWGSDSSSSTDDAYKNLDPSLREFLSKESPNQNTPPQPKSPSQPPPPPDSYRSQLGIAAEPVEPPNPSTAQPAVPPQSLYPDGRYSELWKSYRPLEEIEAVGKSDTDRLADVVDAYHERRAQIGRAAVENCVLEQLEEKDCFLRGGWHARMTMCRQEGKAFNRCYTMQSRFLKALGYQSLHRTPDEEERIQMHADKLYQQMLEREALADAAKQAGKPEPVFQPLISSQSAIEALGVKAAAVPASAASETKTGLEIFAPYKREEIEKSLEGKTTAEKELEIQLRVAEAEVGREYTEIYRGYLEAEQKNRAGRRERGKETFGDTIKRVWGWDS